MAYKSFFNWSGGKDSALGLYHALKNDEFSIELLLTNVSSQYHRVSMHGVREELITQQAACIGLPLQKLILPDQPSMEDYERVMSTAMTDLNAKGFTHSFFGDIFLEDLRVYREQSLQATGIKSEFPLWKKDTTALMHEFIDLGFKSIVVCTKANLLDESFTGRLIDHDFLKDLPTNIDPCGENGEFHTFVYDGPIFKKPVSFNIGEKVLREYKAPRDASQQCFKDEPQPATDGFWFCDLLPVKNIN